MTPHGYRSRQAIGYGCIFLILATTVYSIVDLRGLGLDFANFYDAGRKAANREFRSLYDPFAPINGEKPFGNMLYFSAPAASYLFAPLALLPPAQAARTFMSIGAACIFFGLGLQYLRILRSVEKSAAQRTAFFALFFFCAMLFQPFWTVLQVGGQTTPLIFFCFVLGMLSYERSYFALTALLLVVIVLVKPAFVVGAALLFLIAPVRFKVWSVICGTFAIALSMALVGWSINLEFIELLRAKSGEPEGVPYYNSHMFAWVQAIMVSTGQATEAVTGQLRLINLVLRALVLIWIAAILWRASRSAMPKEAYLAMSFVLCMLASLVVSPVVWAHYLMLMFIPLAYVLAYLLDQDENPTWTFMVLLAVGVLVAPLQNLLILNQLIKLLSPLSHGDLIALTVAKSALMLLLMTAFLLWPAVLQRAFIKAAKVVQ